MVESQGPRTKGRSSPSNYNDTDGWSAFYLSRARVRLFPGHQPIWCSGPIMLGVPEKLSCYITDRPNPLYLFWTNQSNILYEQSEDYTSVWVAPSKIILQCWAVSRLARFSSATTGYKIIVKDEVLLIDIKVVSHSQEDSSDLICADGWSRNTPRMISSMIMIIKPSQPIFDKAQNIMVEIKISTNLCQ